MNVIWSTIASLWRKKCDAAWHHYAVSPVCHKIQRSCRYAKWHQHAVRMITAAVCDQCQAATSCDRQRFLSSHDFRARWQRYAFPFECLSFGLILFSNRQEAQLSQRLRDAWRILRGFRAQRFYLKKSKFFRKRVIVFCKFHFLILPTRSDNCILVSTALEGSCTRPVHGRVHGWGHNRGHGSVHGRGHSGVHGRVCTRPRLYTAVHTACKYGRVHGRVRVYTAVCGPCTRGQGRVHRCVVGLYTDACTAQYTAVYTAVYTACTYGRVTIQLHKLIKRTQLTSLKYAL